MTDIVDRYAELHAHISEVEAEMSTLKAQLVAAGEPTIKGTFVKAVISTSKPRITVDWRSVAAELKAPPEIVDTYTKVGEPVTTLRLHAN